ncbi:hypothetical protein HZC09_06095 [Candidatus Micrarchaeota archaeon]|nr:hypothetical protein [Candidatus Micrarchaeota archaeon]
MRKEKTYVIALLAALLFVPLIAASNPQGATTTSGPTETSVGADDGASDGVEAGYSYTVNLNATSQTSLWTGYLGNVTGRIQLRGSSNKSMYDWSASTFAGNPLIFAYNATTTPVWTALTGLTGANLDTRYGLETTLSDSATNTFTETSPDLIIGNATYTGGSNKAVATYAYTNVYGSGGGVREISFYSAIAFGDGTANILYSAIAQAIVANTTAYNNASQVNYQMLLFANNKGSTSQTLSTYDFYLQLA